MNSKLLAVVSCLALTTAAHADAGYNGWTLGASMGWLGSMVKLDNPTLTGITVTDNNPKYNQVAYGIHADWFETHANDMVYGIGFGVGYHSGNSTNQIATVAAGALGTNNPATNTIGSLNQKRRLFGEVTARVGVDLGNAIVYGLASVRATNTQYVVTQTPAGANSIVDNKSYYALGIAPGIGFDFKIDQNWSFGAEYRYYFETSRKILNNNLNLKLNSHNLLARLSYHF